MKVMPTPSILNLCESCVGSTCVSLITCTYMFANAYAMVAGSCNISRHSICLLQHLSVAASVCYSTCLFCTLVSAPDAETYAFRQTLLRACTLSMQPTITQSLGNVGATLGAHVAKLTHSSLFMSSLYCERVTLVQLVPDLQACLPCLALSGSPLYHLISLHAKQQQI